MLTTAICTRPLTESRKIRPGELGRLRSRLRYRSRGPRIDDPATLTSTRLRGYRAVTRLSLGPLWGAWVLVG